MIASTLLKTVEIYEQLSDKDIPLDICSGYMNISAEEDYDIDQRLITTSSDSVLHLAEYSHYVEGKYNVTEKVFSEV